MKEVVLTVQQLGCDQLGYAMM
jgi:hypothetical protein